MAPRPTMVNMEGGLLPPSMPATIIPGEGLVSGPSVPGVGPTITVRTDNEAFVQDGIIPQGGAPTRSIRRNPFRYGGGGGGMPSMNSMSPMAPMTERYTPQSENSGMSGSHVPVRVNKLE
jgi:hypothetical protein